MSLGYFGTSDTEDEENWIPCCVGGWDTMPYLYQNKVGRDTKGFFDCTCYKAPDVAQFPRIYYSSGKIIPRL